MLTPHPGAGAGGVKRESNNWIDQTENSIPPQLYSSLENLPLNWLLSFARIATPKPGTKISAHSAPPEIGARDLQKEVYNHSHQLLLGFIPQP